MQGKEITPRSIGKIRKGAYYIPDCPDYEPRINIPKKVNIKDPFTGWNCRNCKNLEINVAINKGEVNNRGSHER